MERWRKICILCCLLQKTDYGKTIKERPAMNGKANHKNKKLHGMSITFCDACRYCFDLRLCKILILISKKLVREIKEHKCYQKHGITCTIIMMQTTKNKTFHACIVRVQDSFAMSTHVCNVFSVDFVKKCRFECSF